MDPSQPRLLAVSALALVVPHWVVTHVNQETDTTPRNGVLRLCQAIPAVSIAPVVRWRDGAGRRVSVRITAPDTTEAVRQVTARGSAGRRRVAFTPSAFGHDAFREGTYRLRVRTGGRTVARGSLRVTGAGVC